MRSDELLSRSCSGLLIVDVQSKLVVKMAEPQRLLANLVRLIDAASVLGLPVQAAEQYPKGLGPTVPELAGRLPDRPEKLTFSCCGVPELVTRFRDRGVQQVVVAGIETHVCVLQTAFDLKGRGLEVFLPADATASRNRIDHDLALQRMRDAGMVIGTTEGFLFEWIETAAAAEFKRISQLVTASEAELLASRPAAAATGQPGSAKVPAGSKPRLADRSRHV